MRRSEPGHHRSPRRGARAAALLLCAFVALPAESATLTLRKLRIDSDPPGAEVVLIGGPAGRTPLTVSERAIYPNDYPDAQAHLYGVVTLTHAGCDPHVHRVTLDDIERGLSVALKCGRDAAAGAPASRPPQTVPATPAGEPSPAAADAAAGRRLRQLQVLQELLDEGLLSPAEEQRIRRRLLDAPPP